MTIPKYTVKQVAEMSGLTVNQLRLWERRYQLIGPRRGENRYRLYTDSDIRLLKYVRDEVEHGASVHAMAALGRERLVELSTAQHPSKPADESFGTASGIQIAEAIEAIKKYDLPKIEALLQRASFAMPLTLAIREIDMPLMALVGELTACGELTVDCEHFITAIVRRRLNSCIQSLGPIGGSRPALIASISGDFHDIGLLACQLQLTEERLPTVNLGPNLPTSDLVRAGDKLLPRCVLLTISSPLSATEMRSLASDLVRRVASRWPLAVGGFEANRQAQVFIKRKVPVLNLGRELHDWLFSIAKAAGEK